MTRHIFGAMSIGKRIRAARDKAKLAQADVAIACGVRVLAVLQWEHDRAVPRADKMALLAQALGVTTDWLLTGKGDGPDVHAHRVTEAAAVREVAAR